MSFDSSCSILFFFQHFLELPEQKQADPKLYKHTDDSTSKTAVQIKKGEFEWNVVAAVRFSRNRAVVV